MKKLILFGALLTTWSINAQNFDWARSNESMNPTSSETIRALSADRDGNVYGVGHFKGAVQFDPLTEDWALESHDLSQDIFIQKWDSNGNVKWVKRIGNAGSDAANDITFFAGNIYITGYFQTSVDFDPNAGIETKTAIDKDAFILALDLNGNFLWVETITGAGENEAYSISPAKSADNLYITGSYSNTPQFAGGPFMGSTGETDVFVLKLNTSGAYDNVIRFGGAKAAAGQGIATDRNGNVYVTGSYIDNLIVPGVPTLTGYSVFLAKLNANLTSVSWLSSIEGKIPKYSHSICTDNENRLFSTGFFTGTTQLQTAPAQNFVSNGSTDIFVREFYTSGFLQGQSYNVQTYGSSGPDRANAIKANACNEIVIAGNFSKDVDFDNSAAVNTLSALGSSDAFILQLSDNLQYKFANSLGSDARDLCKTIAIDSDNNIFSAGRFKDKATLSSGGLTLNSSSGNMDNFITKIKAYPAATISDISTFYSIVPCTIVYNVAVTSFDPYFVPDYEWQILIGGIWTPISSVPGVNYDYTVPGVLKVTIDNNLPAFPQYRCIVKNSCPELLISNTVVLDVRSHPYCVRLFKEPGNDENASVSQFMNYNVYPNPSNSGVFNLEIQELAPNATVQIQDVSGKTIMESNTVKNQMSFDLSNYSKGLYFIKISNGTQSEVKKIIFE